MSRTPLLLLLLLLLPIPPSAIAQHSTLNSQPSTRSELRAFWADAFNPAIKTPEEVDLLPRRPRAANCNAIFVQVRKGGDAYYLSRYEPWASDNPQRFDGLADLIEKAHKGTPRISVHAWINTCAVGKTRGNPHHIAALHPEWLSLSDTGENYDNEATKIDPGNPDAADWTFRVYLDVARHYDVDGIHFDFVRYGSTDGKGRFGYNPVSVARFQARQPITQSQNRQIPQSGNSQLSTLNSQPAWDDPPWMQWRRDQVTALVRKVYAMAVAIKPNIEVSAATITWGDGPHDGRDEKTGERFTTNEYWNKRSAPMTRVFQDWRAWMQEGILDLNCQMAYYNESKHPDFFRHWIDWGKDNQYRRWAVPGNGSWLNPIGDTLKQIDAIRAPSARKYRAHGVLLYSYGGTNAGPDGKEQNYNEEFYAALSQPSEYGKPPFDKPAEYPKMPWKENPKTGHLKGFVLTSDAFNPVDGARVTISGPARRTQLTDGTGFYAFVDLPPGKYRVKIEAKGYEFVVLMGDVRAGQSDTVNWYEGGVHGWVWDTIPDETSPAGTPVWMNNARVVIGSDTFPGNLYVQDAVPGRVRQCRVRLREQPVMPFQPGDIVALRGSIARIDGEQTIDNAVARLVDLRSAAMAAVPTELRGDYLKSTGHPSLIDNVLVAGRVQELKPDSFLMNVDGVPVEVLLAGRKGPGVEVIVRPIPPPEVGTTVRVIGLATWPRSADGKDFVRVRPKTAADISALPVTAGERALVVVRWALLPAAVGLLAWIHFHRRRG